MKPTLNRRRRGTTRTALLVLHVLVLNGFACPGLASPPGPATTRAGTQAQRPVSHSEYSQGLLWCITAKGAPPSYIYGTMHLDTPQVAHMPPAANLAFARARILIAEVNLDRQGQEVYTRAGLLAQGVRLRDLLGLAQFKQLRQIAATYSVDATTLDRMKPWLVTNLIGRPRPHSGIVLDELLQKRAADMGKPVVFLETMNELVQSLDRMPQTAQLKLLRDTIEQHVRILGDQHAALQAYLREDLATLMHALDGHHEDEALAARLKSDLLDARSRRMVRRLQPQLRRGNVFVAVGALHLPGRQGILKALAAQGFRIENIRN